VKDQAVIIADALVRIFQRQQFHAELQEKKRQQRRERRAKTAKAQPADAEILR